MTSIKNMKNPLAISPTFEAINPFRQSASAKIAGISCLESIDWKVSIDWNEGIILRGGIQLTNEILAIEKLGLLDPFNLIINNATYNVDAHYATIWNETENWSTECNLKICIKKITEADMEPTADKLFRIIFPLKDRINWHRGINILGYKFADSNHISFSSRININGIDVFICDIKRNDETWLVIDNETPTTYDNFVQLFYPILLSFGLFTSIVPLDFNIILSSSTEKFEQDISLCGYEKLIPTIRSQYDIFSATTRGFEHILNYNHIEYCLPQLKSLEQNNELQEVGIDIIEKLANNLYHNENLQRTVQMLLEASHAPLEYQAAIFFCALETLCGIKDAPIVNDKIWKNQIVPLFEDVIHKLPQDVANENAKIMIINKISGCNHVPNGDKLKQPFENLGYNPSKIDMTALKHLRNKYLHGRVSGKTFDEQYELIRHDSLSAHKLCCILILLRAGFKGYIINNLVLQGFHEEVNAKEPLFIKIPNM